jgi:hypothetical protein
MVIIDLVMPFVGVLEISSSEQDLREGFLNA